MPAPIPISHMGSSRQLVVGPEGSISTLVAAAILALAVASRAAVCYWRPIATRRRSSGVIRWSASSASSPRSICTQLTVPVKTLLSLS